MLHNDITSLMMSNSSPFLNGIQCNKRSTYLFEQAVRRASLLNKMVRCLLTATYIKNKIRILITVGLYDPLFYFRRIRINFTNCA